MTLTQITKIRGPGIHTTSNIVSHNINSSGIITAVAFKGPFTGSSNIQSGILTATKIDLNGDIDVDGHTNLDNVNVAGVTTTAGLLNIDAGGQANTFKVEDLTDNRVVIAGTGGELEDSGNLTFDGSTLAVTGGVTATTGTFSGNVSIGGTLTYEDVTNIDAVGLITARSGIKDSTLTAGHVVFAGTAGRLSGEANLFYDSSNDRLGIGTASPDRIIHAYESTDNNLLFLESGDTNVDIIQADTGGSTRIRNSQGSLVFYVNGDASSNSAANAVTGLTIDGDKDVHVYDDLFIPDKIVHEGDTNTAIRFPAADTITAETGGSERLRIDSAGRLLYGITSSTRETSLQLVGNSNSYTTNPGVIDLFVGNTPSNLGSMGQICFGTQDKIGARIDGRADQDWTLNSARGTHIRFLTVANGSTSLAERLRINNVGDILLGTDQATIGCNTADGSDNRSFSLCGGSDASQSRGAIITIYGNEGNDGHSRYGSLYLRSGNTTTGIVSLWTQGNERLRIAADGIIETGSSVNGSGHDTNQRFRIGRAGDCNLSIRNTANTTSHTGIDFGDSGDDRSGRIQYMHNGDYMSFHTNGAGTGTDNERLRIDSAGDIFIGTTTDIAPTNGTNLCVSDATISRIILEKQSTIKFGLNVSSGFTIYDETNDAARFTIDSSGNIGINKTTPNIGSHTRALTISNLGSGARTAIEVEGNTANCHAAIDFRSNGTLVSAINSRGTDRLQLCAGSSGTVRAEVNSTGITVTGEVATTQDYPTFRPKLNFDFAGTKKLDPRITYERPGPASYIDEYGHVVIVGDSEPRFDHDPDTGECLGLLIEQETTNLTGAYGGYGSDIRSYNSTLGNAPTSTVVEDIITPTGKSGRVRRIQFHSSGNSGGRFGATSGGNANNPYSASVWAKAVSGTPTVTIDVNDAVAVSYTLTTSKWTRMKVTGTSSNSYKFFDMMGNASADVYFWGWQLEYNHHVSSYIPVDPISSSQLRGLDKVAITDMSGGSDHDDIWNPDEGTYIIDYKPNEPAVGDGVIIGSRRGTQGNGYPWPLYRHDTANTNIFKSYDADNGLISISQAWADQREVWGLTFNKTNGSITRNGTLVQTNNTNMTGLTNANSIWLGSSGTGSNQYSMYVKRFMYYRKRLTNSQLVTLTS